MRAHPAGPRHAEIIPEPDALERPADAGALNALDPQIWPLTARRDERSGSLRVGGLDVRDLVTQYQSPLLVMDEEDFRSRARHYRAAFGSEAGRPAVYYAGKAFLTTIIARWVTEEGLGVDVSTGGELAVAHHAGTPGENIIFHGNNKSVAEIGEAMAAGVGRMVIDSFEDIARIAFVAAEQGKVQPVLIRVTTGVEAHTHEFIATSHEDQKFGFSISSGDASEAVARVLALTELRLIGLHSHIGSQIFTADGFEVAAHRVITFMARIRDELGAVLSELDLGGGLGIKYVAHDQPLAPEQFAGEIRGLVADECARHGLPVPRLAFEPGRAIVGPSMITLYTVGTVKTVQLDQGGARTYVSVDGGMSDNIRTALYDAEYTVTLASRASTAEPRLCRVVGKHCESGDIVVKDCWLPADLAPGDLLAVAATGAYCRSMASNYNWVGRPAVVAVCDATVTPVLRRETITDLLALDCGVDLATVEVA